jgi:mannose-1-phosphate guanylyltransferase/mannose-6-phosphate isomerase
MIVFIIAGGSGTRLWPLSTPEYPKHLLKLTDENSLLQNTFERVSQLTSTDKIFVVSEKSHIEHVYSQLGDLPKENILVEPARRGTASCILLALTELYKRSVDKNEAVLFLWADHIIRDTDGFTATMLRAGEITEEDNKLVFVGVEPTYPSTGLGYIKKGSKLNGWVSAYVFEGFKEKPDRKTATAYFKSGKYLWNTGYLVGTREAFETEFDTVALSMKKDYERLKAAKDIEAAYLDCENVAVDYVLSEKVKEAGVVPGGFDWADVGSFHDLHEMSEQDENGNHFRGENIETELASNCYVRNDTETPVAVIGVDNVVVVNTPSGILVTNKNHAQKVGEVSKRFKK